MRRTTFVEITPEQAQSRSRYARKVALNQPVSKSLVQEVGHFFKLKVGTGKTARVQILRAEGHVGNKAQEALEAKASKVVRVRPRDEQIRVSHFKHFKESK